MFSKKVNKVKRIGIDARFYGPVGKGLGRYTQEIVDGVIKMDTVNSYIIFLSGENYDEFVVKQKNVTKVLVKSRWYSLMEQFELPFLIFSEKIDLMHFPHFNVPVFCPVRFVVTIHDLILTKYPTVRASTLGPLRYWFKHYGYKVVIKNAIWRAKKIIAVSKFTKNDILQNFKIDSSKIIVSYEGVAKLGDFNKDLARTSSSEATLMCYNIKRSYILYVGNAYPHKNLNNLIKIFIELKRKYSDLSLVLVGREDYFYTKLKKFVLECDGERDGVLFPGFVDDKDLGTLYGNALLYVFPSLYEGFGLPPLEAMTYGCPVVASNLASMPEILGKAAAYFDPNDFSEFKEVLEEVINKKKLRDELIFEGYRQIKRYSWDDCSRNTLNVYRDIIKQ